METRYRTIWLSDIHLGTRGCRADALIEFLDAHDSEYLYLVGDIIDFWRLKRAPYWPQRHSDVIRKVLSKARAGTVVTFIPGNHDEYLRRFCDLQLVRTVPCPTEAALGLAVDVWRVAPTKRTSG